MSIFICPVCKNNLQSNQNSLKCINNHSFDLSKYNYVNLLQSQKNSKKRHGDDKLMVKARKDFLDHGYYDPLLFKVYTILDEFAKDHMTVFDCGCGECYYTSNIYNYLSKKNKNITVCGIDIAKDAVIQGAKRNKSLELAVASINNIPLADNSCDVVLNFFAPLSNDEYERIAKQNGIIIRAIPLEYHLWELKESIYNNPYTNDELDLNLNGFDIIAEHEVKGEITLDCNEDIQNLFKMTPYYYKTSREDQDKASKLQSLTTKYEFGIIVYKKK